MTSTFMSTSNFIATIGVNTRIEYTDGGYVDLTNISADLGYLGLSNVRDGISDGYAGSAPLSSYIGLAQQGIKFTFATASGGVQTDATLASTLSLIAAVDEAVPGSVVAIEGPNEINNYPLEFDGIGGEAGAIAYQRALYAAVHANPNLQGVSVDYLTGFGAGSDAVGPDPATTPGLADDDTQHPYPNFGSAPDIYVNPRQALGNETAPFGPAVYTETGYSSNGGTYGDVNQDVQAKYTLDLLFDDAVNGISRTYLYQLLDAYRPGSPQGDDGYGLFDSSNNPKAVAVALHNLINILDNTGAGATTFLPAALSDTITGLPTTGNSLDLETSAGVHDIVIWAEPPIWNEATGTEIAAAVSSVTVQLGGQYLNVEVFDPLSSSSPLQTLSSASSVTVSVTDHPLIIQVNANDVAPATPIPAVPPPPPPSAVIVGQPGDYIATDPGGNSLVELNGGSETVQAYGSDTVSAGSGTSTIYGNQDSHPIFIVGGGAGSSGTFILNGGTVQLADGYDVVLDSGGLTLTGGSGTALISLSGGGNSIGGGTGNTTIYAANSGDNTYTFTPLMGGGSTVIYGFSSSDVLDLSAYDLNYAQIQSETSLAGGSASVVLSDSTNILLPGVTNLSTSNFRA